MTAREVRARLAVLALVDLLLHGDDRDGEQQRGIVEGAEADGYGDLLLTQLAAFAADAIEAHPEGRFLLANQQFALE